MKVAPEKLAQGIAVMDLKPNPKSKEINPWVPYHRLEIAPSSKNLLLKSTNGDTWFEWYVPIEGSSQAFGLNFKRKDLLDLKHLLNGGSFTLEQDTNLKHLIFKKNQLVYGIPYEMATAVYPEPEILELQGRWRLSSQSLVEALRFAARFFETTDVASKSCATLYPDGLLMVGNPKLFVVMRGIKIAVTNETLAYLSFTESRARLVADFVSNLGGMVEVDVWGSPPYYMFRDPKSGNRLVLPGTDAKFRIGTEELERPWTETSGVDRKALSSRAKAFGGRLDLVFRGTKTEASLTVSTATIHLRTCSSEIPILRTIPKGNPDNQTKITLNAEPLVKTLENMTDNSVHLSYDGMMLAISEDPFITEKNAGFPDSDELEEPDEVQDIETEVQPDTLSRAAFIFHRRQPKVNDEGVVVHQPMDEKSEVRNPPETPESQPTGTSSPEAQSQKLETDQIQGGKDKSFSRRANVRHHTDSNPLPQMSGEDLKALTKEMDENLKSRGQTKRS